MFDVAKFIRILGYGVYTIMWSPVILLILIGSPIFLMIEGMEFKDCVEFMKVNVKESLKHDRHFIDTGEWL